MIDHPIYFDLKVERELRGISLEELSKATRIPKSHLIAFEEKKNNLKVNNLAARGYLKAYIDYLGLDPDLAFLKYGHMVKPSELNIQTNRNRAHRDYKPYSILAFVFVTILFLLWFDFTGGGPDSETRQYIHSYDIKFSDSESITELLHQFSDLEISIQDSREGLTIKDKITTHDQIILIAIVDTWIHWSDITEGKEILECLFAGDRRRWILEHDIIMEIGDPDAVRIFTGNRQIDTAGTKQTKFYFNHSNFFL